MPHRSQNAVDHLFVGQHRLIVRAPVRRRVLAVGEPHLEELEEQPLGPPVVLGIAAVEPPRPVEREAHPLERRGLLLDVLVGPFLRMDPALDRRVLGGKPERVPADRVQDVVSLHPPEPRDRVAAAERLRVPQVEVPGGVREHVERVEARPGVIGIVGGSVEVLVLPDLLPLRLDLRGLVAVHRLMVTGLTSVHLPTNVGTDIESNGADPAAIPRLAASSRCGGRSGARSSSWPASWRRRSSRESSAATVGYVAGLLRRRRRGGRRPVPPVPALALRDPRAGPAPLPVARCSSCSRSSPSIGSSTSRPTRGRWTSRSG